MRHNISTALATLMVAAMAAMPLNSYAQSRTTSGHARSSSSSSSSSSASRNSSSSTRSSSTSSTRSVSSSSSSTKSSSTPTKSVSTSTKSTSTTPPRTTQINRTTRSSATSSSSTASSPSVTKSAQTTSRQPSASRESSTVRRSSSSVRPSTNADNRNRTSQVRSNSNVTRSNAPRRDDYRIDNHNIHHIPARDRDFIVHHDVHHFYSDHGHHYFGYRVERIPVSYRLMHYHGIDYYCYNNVFYRRYHDHYLVCRPPFGYTFARPSVSVAFGRVRFSFYSNVYRTYRYWDANNRYIDEQNRIIAQNNAIIAAQNNRLVLNSNAASSSYSIANALGLVQSFAYADREYFYQDGVFYIINTSGNYEVIVPPAGALVEALPDDYDTITLGGVEYYRVDDTVYRLTLVSGTPYLEVLGQMYGQLASQNSYYR